MKLYYDLPIKKTSKSKSGYFRIDIENVPELKNLTPDDITMEKWREYSTRVYLNTGKIELLKVEIPKEQFYNTIKAAYKIVGKDVKIFDERFNTFSITTKNCSFLESIQKIKLYSDLYEMAIIEVRIKQILK